MTINQYIKDQYKKVMDRPPKERWSYFWDYYKWHAIILFLVIAVLIQGVTAMVNKKETVFTGFILNSSVAAKDEAFLQGFYEYAGIDQSKEEVAFYTDMFLREGQTQQNASVFQRIMAGIAIRDADFIVGQPEPFRPCAYHTSKIFADLRDFLDAETLERFADRLYYIDGAVLQKLSAPVGEALEVIEEYPDPHEPELMEDPIPVAIAVSDREAFRSSYYYFPDTTLYLGVIASTARPELTQQFIDYLFS